MDGITIIAEHICRVIGFGELIGTGILVTLLICGGLFLYRFVHKTSTRKETKKITIVCSVLLIAMYIWFWAFQIDKYNTTHMEYTVTVDDSVSFNDFHKRYEIVSINGNEYRVIKK